jgi:opacity protein-like surface antigen
MYIALLTALAAITTGTTTTTVTADDDRAWRAGAGLKLGPLVSNTPGGAVDVICERATLTTDGTALFLGLIVDAGVVSLANADGAPRVETYDATLGLSAREVLDAGAPLELSVYLALTGTARDTESHEADFGGAGALRSYDVAGAIGVAVEHWFTPAVGVRLGTDIGRVAATRFDGVVDATDTQPRRTSIGWSVTGGVALDPSAAVVVAF